MRKILVVEDNKLERAMLRQMLSTDYDIIEAESGTEMVGILRQKGKSISAVLLDIIMPGMDGYEALRRIRDNAIWKQIPVIVTTALTDEESKIKAMSLGANGFASKPYNRELLLYTLQNAIDLHEKSALLNTLHRDSLTNLLNRENFIQTAAYMIQRQEPGYYILSCLNVEGFKIINDQYGTAKGDEVLKHIAACINRCIHTIDGISCRFMADQFGILYPAKYKNAESLTEAHSEATIPPCINHKINIRIGRYLIDDPTIPVSAMYDRATLAAESIKDKYDTDIAEYSNSMRDNLIHEQSIIMDMDDALAAGQFEPWFQPQYNHATGALIGAEALVRWRKNGKLVPPDQFINIFERNGFIYEMDQFIWRQVCRHLRWWLDQGKSPLPVSVNISRYDLHQDNFLDVLCGLVKEYDLPVELLRLEVTESAFAEASKRVCQTVNILIDYGFVVEIDDFGSGYSSLNTLKDVPASILKLDMKFFEDTENSQRSGNIIESVVRMAKWLGMTVIAEGVEDQVQADYLKSLGCYFIQGYFYSKPIPVHEYEELLNTANKESEIDELETVENLDNNAFWNPKSMETLIFNSYVGGASIFEYHNGKTEILRHNKEYDQIFSGEFAYDYISTGVDTLKFLDKANQDILFANIEKAIKANKASACEVRLVSNEGTVKYLRITVRVIARTNERYLFYGVVVDITEQRAAEKKEIENAQRLKDIMDNVSIGITAVAPENGKPHFLFANHQYYKLLGYTKEQFEKELQGVLDTIYEEDRERVLTERTKINEAGSHFTSTYRVITRDGSLRWLQNSIAITPLPGIDDPVQLGLVTDITNEKENVLKMEELLNAIPGGVAIYRVGKTLETLYSSDGVAKIMGIEEDEYELWQQSDLLANAIYEDDAPEVRAQIKRAVASNSPINITLRLNHRDGGTVWVVFSASMIREDSKGKIYYGVFAKPAAEAALYQNLVDDSTTAAIIIEKKSRKILYANPAWKKIEDIPMDQVITGVSVFDLIPLKGQFLSEAELQSLPEDHYRKRHITSRTGKKMTIHARSIKWNGVEAYVCYINDDTELWNSKQKLQRLIDQVPVGIAICEIREGKLFLRYANNIYYQMLGFQREERRDYTGANVLKAIYPNDRAMVMEKLQEIINGAEAMEVHYRTYNSKNELTTIGIRASVVERKEDIITIYCALTNKQS